MRDWIISDLDRFDNRTLTLAAKSAIFGLMSTNSDTPKAPGCTPIKGCLIVTGLAIGLFMLAILYLMRMPGVKAIAVCIENEKQVSAAITRYNDVNGHRPAELRMLAKDYLSDPSVLRCPLDRSPGGKPSYAYNPTAIGKQVMLECDRHSLSPNAPNSKLRVLGDGTSEAARPSTREIWDYAQKRANSKSH